MKSAIRNANQKCMTRNMKHALFIITMSINNKNSYNKEKNKKQRSGVIAHTVLKVSFLRPIVAIV